MSGLRAPALPSEVGQADATMNWWLHSRAVGSKDVTAVPGAGAAVG